MAEQAKARPESTEKDAAGSALKVATMMVGNTQLQSRVLDKGEHASLKQEFNLEDAALEPLVTIARRLQLVSAGSSVENAEPRTQAVDQAAVEKFRSIIWDSFRHIHFSFWVSIIMSIALFLIGTTLVAIAVIKILTADDGGVSLSSLTIGGLGLADFLILFLRRPWEDVAKNLSNSQQVRMIVTSYLSSVSLIQQQRTTELELLKRLTADSVQMIEEFTEDAREQVGSKSGSGG